MEENMNDKSSVQIVGTVAGSATDPLVLITPRGIHISVPRKHVQTVQEVQAAAGSTEALHKVLISKEALLSIQLNAAAWAEIDASLDSQGAMFATSGAPKRIEDTA
jgi:hypothetical protein